MIKSVPTPSPSPLENNSFYGSFGVFALIQVTATVIYDFVKRLFLHQTVLGRLHTGLYAIATRLR